MSILVTGANGQLGCELVRQLGKAAIACSSSQLDIRNHKAVMDVIESARPDVVINCAAYTKVDLAEQDSVACHATNTASVAHLAKACEQYKSVLVQLSTDYVFGADSTRDFPYQENDTTGPQSVYAQSKLEGEQLARAWQRHFIVRTCGLYGRSQGGSNFVETMLRLGRKEKKLRVVNDQVCTPSYTADVAAAIIRLLETEAFGTYHVVNAGATTWHDFAQEIFSQANIKVPLEAISTKQFGAAAPRPRYSVLDISKYQNATGHQLPTWQQALEQYLASR